MRAKGMSLFWLVTGATGAFNTYVNPIGLDAIDWKYYFVYVGWIIVEFVVVYFLFIEVCHFPLVMAAQPQNTDVGNRRKDQVSSRSPCSSMEKTLPSEEETLRRGRYWTETSMTRKSKLGRLSLGNTTVLALSETLLYGCCMHFLRFTNGIMITCCETGLFQRTWTGEARTVVTGSGVQEPLVGDA